MESASTRLPTYVSPSRLSGVILPVTSSLCNDSRKDERCVYLEMTWRPTPSESLLLRRRVSRVIIMFIGCPQCRTAEPQTLSPRRKVAMKRPALFHSPLWNKHVNATGTNAEYRRKWPTATHRW